MNLDIIVCDDEPLALDRLADLIVRCRRTRLVATALHGAELLEILDRMSADLVLLDVEMPRMDGFDVAEALARRQWLEPGRPPLVAFVTAHPEMAIQAFDRGALDFIGKPVRLGRLEQTLARARLSIEHMEARRRLADLSSQIAELRQHNARTGVDRHVWVRKGAEKRRLNIREIDWIGAEGEYVRFHLDEASYLERGSLTDIATRFVPSGFIRIHRSIVINRDRVAAVETVRWGGLRVRLLSGTELPVGRLYRPAIRDLVLSA